MLNDSIMFPVVARDLSILSDNGESRGFPVNGYKATVRPNPNDSSKPMLLGIVGENYQITPNKLIDQHVQAALNRSIPDCLEGMTTKDSTARGGAYCTREYNFPNLSFDIDQGKDAASYATTNVNYQFRFQNGYDGRTYLDFGAGGIDGFCDNGMVFSHMSSFFKRKHTSGLEISELLNNLETYITKSVQEFEQQAKVMQLWAKKTISSEQARKCLEECKISKRKVEKFINQFEHESEQRGASVWSLYSALTYYASHADDPDFKVKQTGNDITAEVLDNRGLEVAAFIEQAAFRELVAA